MVTVCLLVGLGLALCGVILACATKQRSKGKHAAQLPPPLPPRAAAGISAPRVSQTQAPGTRTRPAPLRALPPRRSSAPANAGAARRTAGAGYGPRGVTPAHFPCCPFDKQRNIPGQRQVIFWDSGENCYRCSRGHRFKSNGKLL